ncbi:MAG TPA: quinohemoprotein amine dehydrogenase subunit alpha [Acidobacteriota bacterium]|nr:quinohemoprotein amine dehydrogenase subunit alpha [Acidobacteriota bacterium]
MIRGNASPPARIPLLVSLVVVMSLGIAAIPFSRVAPIQQSDGTASDAGDEATAAGIPVTDRAVVSNCGSCHAVDDDGNMTRISYVRKSPEGWQWTLRRMVMLNGVDLDPPMARDIVRYLSDNHGLAPEEAKPGAFEAEQRLIDHDYTADDTTETTCIQCHSMGRVITQRRTEEEWGLLIAMHRGYFPYVDFQAFRRTQRRGPSGDAPGHPMDHAIEHLSEAFPFDTPEWSAWSANRRPARLAGSWAVAGHSPGRGPVYGTVEVSAVNDSDGEFRTAATLSNPRTGNTTRRSGRAIVYTGFQWRGRSGAEGNPVGSLREVMFVERDWRTMAGRWFTGAYNEIGIDVTLHRADVPLIAGVYPEALRSDGLVNELTIFGANLPADVTAADIDLGPGIEVTEVREASDSAIRVLAAAADDAAIGKRDVFVGDIGQPEGLVVFEQVDSIRVSPDWSMARLGGEVADKQLAQFEAYGSSNGADGEPGTADDIDLGVVEVDWSLEEYSATYNDEDLQYVGTLDDNGLFTPAVDGPNPERAGNRNNIGDVWVVATYNEVGKDRPLRGRSHLVVTVPLYLNWRGWEPGE